MSQVRTWHTQPEDGLGCIPRRQSSIARDASLRSLGQILIILGTQNPLSSVSIGIAFQTLNVLHAFRGRLLTILTIQGMRNADNPMYDKRGYVVRLDPFGIQPSLVMVLAGILAPQ